MSDKWNRGEQNAKKRFDFKKKPKNTNKIYDGKNEKNDNYRANKSFHNLNEIEGKNDNYRANKRFHNLNEIDSKNEKKGNYRSNNTFYKVNEMDSRNKKNDNYKSNNSFNRVNIQDTRNKKNINYVSDDHLYRVNKLDQINEKKNESKKNLNNENLISNKNYQGDDIKTNSKKKVKHSVSEDEKKIDYWNCKKLAGVPFVEKQIIDSYLKIGMEVPDDVRKELSTRK